MAEVLNAANAADPAMTSHEVVDWEADVLPIHGEDQIAEEGMDTYLTELEDYEERLARGEIHW